MANENMEFSSDEFWGQSANVQKRAIESGRLDHDLEILLPAEWGRCNADEILAAYARPVVTQILLTKRIAEAEGTIDKDALVKEFLVGVEQRKKAHALQSNIRPSGMHRHAILDV
jgi:hypothetical protein